jgi:hypothetical protein
MTSKTVKIKTMTKPGALKYDPWAALYDIEKGSSVQTRVGVVHLVPRSISKATIAGGGGVSPAHDRIKSTS